VSHYCSGPPIDFRNQVVNAHRMPTTHEYLPSSAATVLEAARELERAAGASTTPEAVAAALDDLAATLAALDRSCLLAASGLIPPGDVDAGICERYRRAASRWPGGGPAPSYERQAAILASLDDTGAVLRAAAKRCRHARDVLASVTG
jgi:hypothetical protein